MNNATQPIGTLGRPIILPAGWNYTSDGYAITDGRWLIARAFAASAPVRDDEPVQMATGETWNPYEFASVGEAIAFASRN